MSTLLPKTEPDSPVSVELGSPVESVISEPALPGLEILEGLKCDRYGNIRDDGGKLVAIVDEPAGKKKNILTCYKRRLVCNHIGEFEHNGVVLTRARLVTTEKANDHDRVVGWGGALPLEPSGSSIMIL